MPKFAAPLDPGTEHEVPVAHVLVDPQLQVRTIGLNEQHVRALEETPKAWPPILVSHEPPAFRLVDGFHRFAAAQNLGLARICVRIAESGSQDDLVRQAFEANARHGLALTLADKRAFADRLLRGTPQLSNMETSRLSNLSVTTVGKIRRGLEEDSKIPIEPSRKGRDGKTYPAPAAKRISADLEPVAKGRTFTAKQRVAQRAAADYLEKLIDALEDQWNTPLWKQGEEQAAEAIRLAKGAPAAKLAGETLRELCARVMVVVAILTEEKAA
jgi:ParB-like chromosome segregation protein Spo0J